jgi:hypothetical protein
MFGLKYIPSTSFINTTKLYVNKVKINKYNMYVGKTNIFIDLNMNFENHLILENIKINMYDNNVRINYYHRILYNDHIMSNVNIVNLDSTLWGHYNNNTKKLYYQIIKE